MKWIDRLVFIGMMIGMMMVAGCANTNAVATAVPAINHDATTETLTLPNLTAVTQNGTKLQVIATTSIIGDVVANVGGSAIDLTVLMGPGQDPHSYQPGAADLTAVARAHVIFVNGWNLEEGLLNDLQAIGEATPIVPISANITPLALGADGHDNEEHADQEDHYHSGADPHVWLSVRNVEQWTQNVSNTLSALDPDNAATYAANAAQYLTELTNLQQYAVAQLAAIPTKQRILVTNHDALSYFARDYSFEILGTVIPGLSTLAEPATADLADLIRTMQDEGICTIFSETSVSDALANTVAAELDNCNMVQVPSLYTGALGPAGSGADTYITMFRTDIDAIVKGLGQ